MYAYDRAITWETKLKEEYENGSIILLDRYTTSSIIYQSTLIENKNVKKDFIDYISDYEYNKLGIGKPDLVIFLTLFWYSSKSLIYLLTNSFALPIPKSSK